MNSIREINRINQRELELGVKGSWHDEYKDSAYIFVGGLSYDLTEGDVVSIFSQWGEIVDINLPRDKETGKTRGFGFVMYEDQRSTVLAVDNMNGAQVLGRTIRVDHCRKYNQPGTKNDKGEHVAPEEPSYNAMPPILSGSEESESSASEVGEVDEEDPMAAFLRAERKREKEAKRLTEGGKGKRKREAESKEERRRRKEEKRAKRKAREDRREGKEGREVKRERESTRDRYTARVGREGERVAREKRDDWGDRTVDREREMRDERYDGRERNLRRERDGDREWDRDRETLVKSEPMGYDDRDNRDGRDGRDGRNRREERNGGLRDERYERERDGRR